MTCHIDSEQAAQTRVRINRHKRPTVASSRDHRRIAHSRLARVRVTHASVGVTDAMAAKGDYLLQPVPGFTPGYDFVGVVEHVPTTARGVLQPGQRVAGALPRMGAHAGTIHVPASLLVAVPDALDSEVAATIPLDAVTALFALNGLTHDLPDPHRSGRMRRTRSVLIQGAGGAVGSWAVQLAATSGAEVYGTGSTRTLSRISALGAEPIDYRDPAWIDELVARTHGGVVGIIDHTGDTALRRAVRRRGTIIRLAFQAQAQRSQSTATARGFIRAGLRRYADPAERVCSAPLLIATRRATYRRYLTSVLAAVAAHELTAPEPVLFPLRSYPEALHSADTAAPGTKVVLRLTATRG